MKKLLSLLFFSLYFVCRSGAQDTTSYYGKMNYVFTHVDKSQVTSGLLKDYGIDFLNVDNYSGNVLNDSNFVAIDEWRLLYASLYSAQINNNAQLLYLDTINNRINSFNQTSQPISFTVLHYTYQSLREDALTSNLFTISNEQLYDVSGRSQSPYQSKELFAIAPIRQAAFIGNNQIIFRPELFFSNTGKTIGNIAVDLGDTGNYQTVAFNTPFTINYSTAGFYNINIRITYTDATISYGHTKIGVYANNNEPDQSEQLRSGKTYRFSGGRTLTNETIVSTKSYLGQTAQGDITIQLALDNNTGQIRKPLIIVEGFDPDNSYSFRSFVQSINFDNNFSSITLNEGLDDINEYDLIFLDFANATDYIQKNAYLLESVINLVNTRKTIWQGTRQQNVIIGLSMGGLAVRYGLRDMELNNQAHETRLFISHDTPHHGANIPVGAQAAVQHLGPFKIINNNGSFPFIRWIDMFPEIASSLTLFNSPAARQMIIQKYNLNDLTGSMVADNSVHESFMNEINTMGWPTNCTNLTLSNGSSNGTKIFPANSRIFELIGGRSMSYFGSLWRSALISIGTVFSPIITNPSFNGWAMASQFPLSLFSTKSSINLDFRINAVPQSGISELYRGDIYSKRKILWTINVYNYFVKCRINSKSEMLPLDNAPGGLYDLNEFGLNGSSIETQLPEFFNGIRAAVLQPRFCFVPTVSSLAITNPWQNLNTDLYNVVNCLNPSGVNGYFAPLQNEPHISYTQASSNWLLQRQNSSFNCIKICVTGIILTGPSQICSSNTYTITNVPIGASVTWSTNLPGIVSMSPSGNSVTITKILDGSFTLSARINSICENVILTKNIAVGVPTGAIGHIYFNMGQPKNPLNLESCETEGRGTFEYRDDFGNSSTISSGYQFEVISGPNYTFTMGSGAIANFRIKNSFYGELSVPVRVKNSCGWSISPFYLRINVARCTGGGSRRYVIYPNPVSTELNISYQDELEQDEKTNDFSKKTDYEASLFNSKGVQVKSGRITNGKKSITLPIHDIPNGTYFLHILEGKTITKSQIIIQH